MAKRALLIGSQTGKLEGVHTDVRAVADRLGHWGFTTELCMEGDATRQGILERYRNLIDATAAGDTVVVYYSGHGGLAANPDYRPMTAEGVVVPRYHQFIVPVDIDEGKAGDFRGITSIELSALLAQLTDKTRNATVILDCCHSARMSRNLDLVPRAMARPWRTGIAEHMEQLAAQGLTPDRRHMESNPYAVRLVACAPRESAYEYTNDDGKRVGLLTESLLIAMEEAEGLKVSWRSLGVRVRERVLSVVPYQRPEIEGPGDRVLFELDTVERTGILPVVYRDDQPVLQGGRLLGVNPGDVYDIGPMGAEKCEPENCIARAVVEEVLGDVSRISLDWRGEHTEIPAGANAFPVSTALPKRPVRLLATGEEAKALSEAIEDSTFVRVAAEDDPAEVLAELAVADGQIELRDQAGLSLLEPKPFSQLAVTQTKINLDRFARVQTVLNLRSGEGPNALDTPYRVEWGRVVDGKPQPLDHSGEVVFVGEPIYVQVINKGQGSEKIYVSLFDVGLSGKIILLSRSQPAGHELEPGQDYVYGQKEGKLVGKPLSWAAGVPKDAPRRESLVVIVSDVAQDLRGLEQRGMRSARGEPLSRQELSPLQEMMQQIGYGGTRDAPPEGQDIGVRYSVDHISLQLDPNPVSRPDRGDFLLDDRQDLSVRLLMPEAKGEPPSKIAIRLKELIVHSNRALFSTEVRVDAIVVTGSDGDSDRIYKTETYRFPRVKDGDHLSFGNLVIYHGPAVQFVDMAVWVSRDQKDSLTLAELFKTELNSAEFKTAAIALAGLAVAAPQAAVIAGAVAAGATLVNIGTKLLLQAAGTSIGLYRTSFLKQEQYGVGRHPPSGVMPAQDFSFSYEVIAVD